MASLFINRYLYFRLKKALSGFLWTVLPVVLMQLYFCVGISQEGTLLNDQNTDCQGYSCQQAGSRSCYNIPNNEWGQGNTTEGCRINSNIGSVNVKDPEPNKYREISQWDIKLGQVKISNIFSLCNCHSSYLSFNHPGNTSFSTPLRL